MVAGDDGVGEEVLMLVWLRVIAKLAVAGPAPLGRMRRAKSPHAAARGSRCRMQGRGRVWRDHDVSFQEW